MTNRVNVRWDKRRGWHIGQQMEELDDDGVLVYGNGVIFTTVTAEDEDAAIPLAEDRARKALDALCKVPLIRINTKR